MDDRGRATSEERRHAARRTAAQVIPIDRPLRRASVSGAHGSSFSDGARMLSTRHSQRFGVIGPEPIPDARLKMNGAHFSTTPAPKISNCHTSLGSPTVEHASCQTSSGTPSGRGHPQICNYSGQ
jgi:hypothetical protein